MALQQHCTHDEVLILYDITYTGVHKLRDKHNMLIFVHKVIHKGLKKTHKLQVHEIGTIVIEQLVDVTSM